MLILKNVGFDRLKVFYFVFSKLSVIAAAKTLNLSQSAVSQSIQKLENELKCQLFTRMHKKLIPTAIGERLFTVVKPFITDLDSCLKTINQAKERPFGVLRIGTPMEFGKMYFPAIVASFRNKYPEVTFNLELGDPNTLLTMLKKGQIDIALVDVFQTRNQYYGNLDTYHFQSVAQEEIILACSKQYYDNFVKEKHSFKHLAKQSFITYQPNSQTIKAWFNHHFNKPNLSVHSVLTVNSHQAIITAIQNHVGMGIIASHFVNEEIKAGQIVRIKTSRPEIRNEISLTQLLDKIPTVTEKVFIKFLLKKIESLGLEITK